MRTFLCSNEDKYRALWKQIEDLRDKSTRAIIGVVVSKLNAVAVARITSDIPQNVNFAIKASAVTNLLDANSVKYRNDAAWRDLSVETLTRQMKEYTVKLECH